MLLATGASKADAVDAMLGEPSRHVPASLLRRERLTVIVDDAAAPPRCALEDAERTPRARRRPSHGAPTPVRAGARESS